MYMKTENTISLICLDGKPFNAYATLELAEKQVELTRGLVGLLGKDKALERISVIEMEVFSEGDANDG